MTTKMPRDNLIAFLWNQMGPLFPAGIVLAILCGWAVLEMFK